MRPTLFSTLVILIGIISALGATGFATARSAGTNRLSVRKGSGTKQDPTASLTKAQKYAYELTRRAPTRRQTAQRRQVSEIPRRRRDIGLSVVRTSDGTHIGFMVMHKASATSGLLHKRSSSDDARSSFNANGLIAVNWEHDIDSSSSSTALSFSLASGATLSVANSHRIVMSASGDASLVSDFPVLGLVQCSTSVPVGSPVGPGFRNYLCLAGVADPGVNPVRQPTLLSNALWGNGKNYPAETDIWDVNQRDGIATAHWVNADGTTVPLVLLAHAHSGIVYATGDVELFRAEMGSGFELLELKL